MDMVLQNAILGVFAWVAVLRAFSGDVVADLQCIIFRKALDIGGDLC